MKWSRTKLVRMTSSPLIANRFLEMSRNKREAAVERRAAKRSIILLHTMTLSQKTMNIPMSIWQRMLTKLML